MASFSALVGAQTSGVKAEVASANVNGESAHIKVEPPSNPASPAAASDEDIYEDAGDLDFSKAVQGLYLTRIPRYLWDNWANLEDDQEIQLGTIRVEGSLEDVKRVWHCVMSLILSPDIHSHHDVPKEYNMHITNQKSMNTYIFTEKNLQGYTGKDEPATHGKAGGGGLASHDRKPFFQNRPYQTTQQRSTSRRMQPYRRTIPKQTALVGQIHTEMNCLPVENAEYKRAMDARTREAMSKPRRETKMVEKEPQGRVYAPTGLRLPNAFEIGFTKQTKPTAGKGQHYKAARIAANDLKDMIFNCFRKYNYWPIRAMKNELDQPETYLRQVLEEVAQLVRNGPFANCWQLRPEYKETSYENVKEEAAPVADFMDVKDTESAEDEEDIKMEDVLPT
ncbi:MAG: hypothetical protein Q9220_003291 [cf. Caloplaca sp. 1 TL-2023]